MQIFEALMQCAPLQKLVSEYPTHPYPSVLNGVPLTLQGLLGAFVSQQLNRTAIFVTPGEGEAEKIADCLRGIFSDDTVGVLPAQDLVLDAVDAAAADTAFSRLKVLGGCLEGRYRAIVTTAEGFAARCPAPATLQKGKFKLSVGDSVAQSELLNFLAENGYTRLDMVEGAGGYAVRGSIVDVFPPDAACPIRIDFFDDEVDQIGLFDVISQRKIETKDTVTLGAATIAPGKSARDAALALALEAELPKIKHPETRRRAEADIELLRNGLPVAGRDRYLPLEIPVPATLTDYVEDPLLIVCDFASMRGHYEFLSWQIDEDGKRMAAEHLPFFPERGYFLPWDDFCTVIAEQKALFVSALALSGYSGKLSFLDEISVAEDVLTRNDPAMLMRELSEAVTSGQSVFYCTGGKGDLISKMLAENGIPFGDKIKKGCVCLVPISLRTDCLIDHRILVLGDNVGKKGVRRRVRHMGEKIKSYADITPGDLVVHVHHGIGIYRGIRRVDNHGVVKDYLMISYDKGDTLYVPTPQLDLISKYVGTAEDSHVKLSRLGTAAWEKTKQKAKNEARILAKELIELYAKRQRTEGHAFSHDTDWQRQFEDNFAYIETDDQLRCVAEIKEDMEKPYPMDRLLCGDVGFGKTEVALRAVFKAVSDSKQAAILAPTTILSEQHLKTVRERFLGFPIRAEVLNRFKTKKQQDEILRRLRRGEIDIIIGTHRLLQKDVAFKDLGLLVVDEEQRFGVKHKEAIKQLSLGVDVLTLSATPIPRTLNMALSGIRDMSLIEEAPADRHPVATYVLEYDENVVIGAIRREMRRHGCVYYLKNDIESLDHIAARIGEILPTARIAVAHGKMSGAELEKIWARVMAREVDILLCTTIIETGIDMAFTNTLIIEDADRMGLAQLHQIRGRIGRSNVRAYAYLTYRMGKMPSDVATKRLMTIREFTEFGSGFKIAMRDLEIRGAGSVLGERQHGHLNSIGYDLYMKILNEAVSDEKGSVPQQRKSDCVMDIAVSAYLPTDYVEHEESRIDLYKKIAAIENDDDFSDITDELCDRFGEPPAATVNLMRIARLRGKARHAGVSEIKQKGSNVLIYLENGDPDVLFAAVRQMKGRLLLSNGATPYLTLRLQSREDTLSALEQVIGMIAK